MNMDANDVKLNLKIAQILTLKLPNEHDRAVSTKWLTALEQCTAHDEEQPMRLRCLKLLLLILHRGRLVGPFKEAPLMVAGPGCMPAFDNELKLIEIERQLAEEESSQSSHVTSACLTHMSGSMHAFVAYQEIPKYGAHFYYALSESETVQEWNQPLDVVMDESEPSTMLESDATVLDGGIELILPSRSTGQANSVVDASNGTPTETEETRAIKVIPKHLAERLSRKCVAKKDSRLRTPLIFRKDSKRPFRIRYKPEEFGLTNDEPFYPAHKFLAKLKSLSPYFGLEQRIQVRNFIRRQHVAMPQDKRSPETVAIHHELQRSMQRRMLIKQIDWQQIAPEIALTPTTTTLTTTMIEHPRSAVVQRLQALRQHRPMLQDGQPHQTFSPSPTTTIPPFERFVLKNLSSEPDGSSSATILGRPEIVETVNESSTYSELTVLHDNEMYIDDVFGADHIAVPSRPTDNAEKSADEGILGDSDMYIDDIFGEANMADIAAWQSVARPSAYQVYEQGRRLRHELGTTVQPLSTPDQPSVPAGIEAEPSVVEELSDSCASKRLSDEMQPSFRSYLDVTVDTDASEIIVSIPIPGRPGTVTYAPIERAEQVARLLDQVDDVTKTILASIGQTFKVGVLKKRYATHKGRPGTNQRPTFDALYAAVDPDLLDPIAEPSFDEPEANIMDRDVYHPSGLMAPLLGSPMQPKRERHDDRVQGYHDYLEDMKPYAADANAMQMVSSEVSDDLYSNDDLIANRRILRYSESSSLEAHIYHPDLLLDPNVAPHLKPDSVKFRERLGILDESIVFSDGPSALIPGPKDYQQNRRRDPDLLSSDEMLIDDVFGENAVADMRKPMPSPAALKQAEQSKRVATPKLNDDRHRYFSDLAAGHHRYAAYEPDIDEELEPSMINSASSSRVSSEENIFDVNPEWVSLSSSLSEVSERTSENISTEMAGVHHPSTAECSRSSDGLLSSGQMLTDDIFGNDAVTEPLASYAYGGRLADERLHKNRQQTESFQDDILDSDDMRNDMVQMIGSNVPALPHHQSVQYDGIKDNVFNTIGANVATTPKTHHKTPTSRGNEFLTTEDMRNDILQTISENVITPNTFRRRYRNKSPPPSQDEILNTEDMRNDIVTEIGKNVIATPSPAQRRSVVPTQEQHHESLGSSSCTDDENVCFAIAVPQFNGAFVFVSADRIAPMIGLLTQADDVQKVTLITDAQVWLAGPNRPRRIIYPNRNDTDDDLRCDLCTIFRLQINRELLNIGDDLDIPDWPAHLTSVRLDNGFYALPAPGLCDAFVYTHAEGIGSMLDLFAILDNDKIMHCVKIGRNYMGSSRAPKYIYYLIDDAAQTLQKLQRIVDKHGLPQSSTEDLGSDTRGIFFAVPVPAIDGTFLYVRKDDIYATIRFLSTASEAEKIQRIEENQKWVNGMSGPCRAVYLHTEVPEEPVQTNPDELRFAIAVPGLREAFVYVRTDEIDDMVRYLAIASEEQKSALVEDARALMSGPNRPLRIIYANGDNGAKQSEQDPTPPVPIEIVTDITATTNRPFVSDPSPQELLQFSELLHELDQENANRQRSQQERTGESLANSLDQSVRYRALRQKYRHHRGLDPLVEDDYVFPALQQLNDSKSFEEPIGDYEPIGTPVAALLEGRDELGDSIEKRLQYAIDAERRPLQMSDAQQRRHDLSDPLNQRINMSTIESDLYEEPTIDELIHDHMHTPPRHKYRPNPTGHAALLDESLELNLNDEPLLKGPANFPHRYDSDVLNESEMYVDDIFGNDAIAKPAPLVAAVDLFAGPKPISPAYVRDEAKEKAYHDLATGKLRYDEMILGDLEFVEEPAEFYDLDLVPEMRILPPTPARTQTPERRHIDNQSILETPRPKSAQRSHGIYHLKVPSEPTQFHKLHHPQQSPTTAATSRAIQQTVALDKIKRKMRERQAPIMSSATPNYTAFAQQRRSPTLAVPNLRDYDDDLKWQHSLYDGGDDLAEMGTGYTKADYDSPLNRRIQEQQTNDLSSTSEKELLQSPMGILNENEMITDDVFGADMISEPLRPRVRTPQKSSSKRLPSDTESIVYLSQIEPPSDLYRMSCSETSENSVEEHISAISMPEEFNSDEMPNSGNFRRPVLPDTIRQQQIIALTKDLQRLQDLVRHKEAIERHGNLAQYAVDISVAITNKHKDLHNRYRSMRGLSPLADDETTVVVPDNRTKNSSYLAGQWLASPIALDWPQEEPINVIDAFERSLDNILEYANEANRRPFDGDWNVGASDLQSYHDSDFFNRNIIGNITMSEEEPAADLWHESGDVVGQRYLDVTPGILDDSLYDEHTTAALIQEPHGFKRRRDVLNESEMHFNDMFGDDDTFAGIPMEWRVNMSRMITQPDRATPELGFEMSSSSQHLSAEEQPSFRSVSDASPIIVKRQQPTSDSQVVPDEQSGLHAKQIMSIEIPIESFTPSTSPNERNINIDIVRRRLFAADASPNRPKAILSRGNVVGDDDELPEDERNFVWLERMVPQANDPRRVQILSNDTQLGRQRTYLPTPDPRTTNNSTDRKRNRGRSINRNQDWHTDWQQPPPKVITPRMNKAIAVNHAFMEKKKRKRMPARQPVPSVEAAVPPPPLEVAEPMATELIIAELKKRIRRAKGLLKTPSTSHADAVDAATLTPLKTRVLPSERGRIQSARRTITKEKFLFDLTSPKYRRAVEVNRRYEEEVQRKKATREAQKTANREETTHKSMRGRQLKRSVSAAAPKFPLELTEAQHARAVEVNRVYEEDFQRKKQTKKDRRQAAVLTPTLLLTKLIDNESSNWPAASTRQQLVDIVQQLRERMWAKLGKPALSEGAENLKVTPSSDQFMSADAVMLGEIDGLPTDRHAAEKQKRMKAKRITKKTRSLPSRHRNRQPAAQSAFKFDLASPQFARALEVNRLYVEEHKLKKEQHEARKAKHTAATMADRQYRSRTEQNEQKSARAVKVNRLYEEEQQALNQKQTESRTSSVGRHEKHSKHRLRPTPGTERRPNKPQFRMELTSPQHRRAVEVNRLYEAKKQAIAEARKKELQQDRSKSGRQGGSARSRFVMKLNAERKARAIEVNRNYEEEVDRENEMRRAKRDGTWVAPPQSQQQQKTLDHEETAAMDPIAILRQRMVDHQKRYVAPATETLGHNPLAAFGPHPGVPTARQLWKSPEPRSSLSPKSPHTVGVQPNVTETRRGRPRELKRPGDGSEFKFNLTSPQCRRAFEVNRMYEEKERLKKEAKTLQRTKSVGPTLLLSKSGISLRTERKQRAMSVGRAQGKFKFASPKLDRALRVNEIYLAEQAAANQKKEETNKRRAEKHRTKETSNRIGSQPSDASIKTRFKLHLTSPQMARSIEVNRLYMEGQRLKAQEQVMRDAKRTKSLGLPTVKKRSEHRMGNVPATERKQPRFQLEQNAEQHARAVEVNRQYLEAEKLKKQRAAAKRAGLPWPLEPPQTHSSEVKPVVPQHGPMVDGLLQRIALAPPIHLRTLQGPLIEGIRLRRMQHESTPERQRADASPIVPVTPPHQPLPLPRDRRSQAIEVNDMYRADVRIKKQKH